MKRIGILCGKKHNPRLIVINVQLDRYAPAGPMKVIIDEHQVFDTNDTDVLDAVVSAWEPDDLHIPEVAAPVVAKPTGPGLWMFRVSGKTTDWTPLVLTQSEHCGDDLIMPHTYWGIRTVAQFIENEKRHGEVLEFFGPIPQPSVKK